VWVILALNNIVNPFEDWLLSDEEVKDRIKKKYGSKLHDAHHYEQDGILYTSLPEIKEGKPITKITNYEYEMAENEKKRTIKVLYPHLLSTIEKEVKGLFK
jgi:hypothetical protein